MSVTPDLEMKKLEGDDAELGLSLAASLYGDTDFRAECFGLTPDGAPARPGEGWGIYIRGGLSAAAWLAAPKDGWTEITTLAIARRRWGMGLLRFMADGLARKAALSGGDGLLVRLPAGTPGLGEALTEAEFTGPDPEDETYPAGDWIRPCVPPSARQASTS